MNSRVSADKASSIAEEAYLYAFPMLMGYRYLFGAFLAKGAPSYRGPVNILGSDSQSLDWRFKDVITPNADTPYSFAALDLRAEPYVLTVPEVTDRYYVMQLEDLLGFNEHYVGTRATGTGAGSYLLAGPGWAGDVPDTVVQTLRFETDIVFIIGRTQLLGPDDVSSLQAVQAGYRLQSLSGFAGTPPPPEAPSVDWPMWDDEASRDERFIGYVNFLLSFCEPVHPDDAGLMRRMSEIGIGPRVAFDADALDPDLRHAIRAGVQEARRTMQDIPGEVFDTGWSNTDPFGDRAFYAGDYLKRAAMAMFGWGGNDRVEAFYPMLRHDADGEPFDGSKHAYTMTWATDPPTQAFWSVTIYDTSYDGTAGYLVKNPIDRYLVNSTTRGLVRGDDGSLTINIQHARPEDGAAAANWLPAPDGPFYLVLRNYFPKQEALDGSWVPPAVVKAR
jgi:hypothetical protein